MTHTTSKVIMDDSDAHAAELQRLRQSNALLDSQWHKAESEIESLRQSNAQLVELGASMLAYIEMKLTHTGTMSVEQIMEKLKGVDMIAYAETAHHLGCSKTTRTVDLESARKAFRP